MRHVWISRCVLVGAIAALCAAALLAALAPDAARAMFFPRDDWPSLSAEEQRILHPLADDWAGMRYMERERWRTLVSHFERLSPSEQQRVEKRMRRWAAATPKERHAARESYQKLKGERDKKAHAVAAWPDYAAARGLAKEGGRGLAPSPIVTAQATP